MVADLAQRVDATVHHELERGPEDAMVLLVDTTDADTAYEAVSRFYHVRRLATPGGGVSVRIVHEPLGPAALHFVRYTMDGDIAGDPLRSLYFSQVADGAVSHRYAGVDVTYTAGDVFIPAAPDRPFTAAIHGGVDTATAELDVSVLAQVAATAPGRRPQPLRFTGYQPTTGHDRKLWLDTFAFVRGSTDNPVALTPLTLAMFARLLAAVALTAFPNNALTDPTAGDRRDAHPASLRRAVSFIDDNAHRDISPADIAAAAHVTVRTLQLAFRRHLGTTPTGHLRRVRLDRAHHEMRGADPAAGVTVSGVAARWGFVNHSRFSAEYRATYGVTPSQTLRR